MPTYQYRCTECGHDLEAVQKFTDSALTECPNCGGQLRKVFNAVGVVFKGSGFYRTDSRSAEKVSGNGGSGNGGSGDGGASGDGGSGERGGEKKSDGKESAAPAKEKAGSGAGGGSSANGSAKPAASGSGSGSGGGSSTPVKAARS